MTELEAHQQTIYEARNWAKNSSLQMRQKVSSYGIRGGNDGVDLNEAIRDYTDVRNYLLNKISFVFPRYGIWFDKGASRGHAGQQGRTRWRRSDGSYATVNPASIGKMNTGNRKQKPWFDEVIKRNYPLLQDIVLKGEAKATLQKLENILIK